MTKLIVVFPKMENGKKIKNILIQNGFSVVSVCTSGAQVIQEANELEDGVVISTARLPDMMFGELKEYLPPGFQLVVIASKEQWNNLGDPSIVSLSLPLKVHELLSTMEMVTYNVERARKRRKAKPKRRSAEEQEMISRAKAVLMNRNNMSEEEAHRYLQKTSMDNGTSFTETAQMILSMMDK